MKKSLPSVLLRSLIGFLCLSSGILHAQFQTAPVRKTIRSTHGHRKSNVAEAWAACEQQPVATAIPFLDRKDSIPSLDEIREQKRQRLQAIFDRLQQLRRSTPSTAPVIDSLTSPAIQLPDEAPLQPPPVKQQTPAPDDAAQTVQPPENVAPTQPDTNEIPETGDSAGLTIPQISPLDDLAPSAKATTPTTVEPDANLTQETTIESPDIAQPKSPITDMIEAITKSSKPQLPASPAEVAKESPSTLSATTVLNSPVDRLKLADNLFASGEYSLALQMYDAASAPKSKLEGRDKTWVTYQKAGCYRRLGMMDDAESLYRQVAGDADTEWLAGISRWWLDRIAEREKLNQEIGQIKEVLDTFKKAKLDANSNPQ